MDVGTPIVRVFLLRLSPCVVAAAVLGRVGTHVHVRPQSAGRQFEVNCFETKGSGVVIDFGRIVTVVQFGVNTSC